MQELVRRVNEALDEPWNKRTGRPKSLGLRKAVEAACMYLRQNAAQEFIGDVQDTSQPTIQGFKSSVVSHGATVGIDVEVVERNPADKGFVPQPKRWVVEQTYGILALHRRLVRDYEHRPASSESRVYWAMSDVMARRLTGTSTPAWRGA